METLAEFKIGLPHLIFNRILILGVLGFWGFGVLGFWGSEFGVLSSGF